MNRIGRKRLHIDVPDALFKELKLLAVEYQCTMTKIVLKALVEKLKRERGFVQGE